VAPQGFTDDQRRQMLGAVHDREGKWDRVDPNAQIASTGEDIGLSKDESYRLVKLLMDEGYIDPGHVYGGRGAMPGHTIRVVGHGDNVTSIGDNVRLTGKGQAELG
jgi:hypothetical protein